MLASNIGENIFGIFYFVNLIISEDWRVFFGKWPGHFGLQGLWGLNRWFLFGSSWPCRLSQSAGFGRWCSRWQSWGCTGRKSAPQWSLQEAGRPFSKFSPRSTSPLWRQVCGPLQTEQNLLWLCWPGHETDAATTRTQIQKHTPGVLVQTRDRKYCFACNNALWRKPWRKPKIKKNTPWLPFFLAIHVFQTGIFEISFL